MGEPKSKKMDFEQAVAPVKQALQFLPEQDRPDFEEFVEKTASNVIKSVTEKQEFKNCRFPPMFLAENAEWQYENWKPNKGDVLISTYPKTGTTWVTEIMRHVLYKGDDEKMKIASTLTQPFTYLECAMPSLHQAYQKFPLERRLYSTHMTSECVNMERVLQSGCKIICVLRNPKDQLVSWFNFTKSLPFYDQGKTAELHPSEWSKYFEKYITGQQPTFCKDGEWYPHHILSWYPYRNHENVKFIYYEDLKKDPVGSIKEIADFVDSKKSSEEIAKIIEDTSLNKMKKENAALSMLFRKGTIGDWKNQFTVAQSEMMDEKTKEILSGTDIKFTYE